MRVETPFQTYDRYRDILDLISKGLEECATARGAASGAKYRRRRHPHVYAGEIRADFIDWLGRQPLLGWELGEIPNSGIELTGPAPATILVRRPDASGHAPGATTERRRQQYSRQLSLFEDVREASEPEIEDGLPLPVATLVVTWGFDEQSGEVTYTLSAPASADAWHWRDISPRNAVLEDGVPVADEADDDPLAQNEDDEATGTE